MAKWIKVSKNYDHRWPSGAVTALVAGTTLHVKDEVADAAIEAGAASEGTKPDDDTPTSHPAPRPRGVTQVVEVVTGGFTGYPDGSNGPVTPTVNPVDAEVPGDRSESVEDTAAGNAATAKLLEAEDKAKGK